MSEKRNPSEMPDVKSLRLAQGLTQAEFSSRYGLDLGTIRNWEQRRSRPDTAGRLLLAMIERHPSVVAGAAAELARQGELKRLVETARRDYTATCLWNVRRDLPLEPMAELVVDRLRKHGGMPGWRLATRIRTALSHLKAS